MSIALPLGKIQTPIFSRDASSRRASEAHVTVNRPSNTKSRSLPHKSLEEANLRVVQYEIAEREACRLIATMCQEGSKILNITGTEYEIDDILSGVLVLGNIYKRIGNEKYNLEATIDGMRKDYSTLETDKNYMIERLENAILRLQMENNKLQENLTEMKLKHHHKMMNAMKEINEHQENLEAAKAEKSRLESKLKEQERRLMEVPRMEEQYQRNARSVVRQQEVANTLKEIGWKKLEGEVKSLNFWKSKAKSLEETVARQKAELDNLSNQGRLSLSRYQNLLLSYNTLKRSHPHEDVTMKAVLAGGAGGASGAGGMMTMGSNASGSRPGSPTPAAAMMAPGAGGASSKKQRPISAPAGRASSPTSTTSNANANANANASAKNAPESHKASATTTALADDAALDELFHQHGHHTIGYGKHRRPTTAGANSSSTNNNNSKSNGKQPAPIFKKTLQNIAAEELERLKDIIASKDEVITKLSRQLSHARAYPLKGIGPPTSWGYESDEERGGIFASEEPKKGLKMNAGTSLGHGHGHHGPAGGEDHESESESFQAEEEEFQRRRVEEAVALQKHFSKSAARARAGQPAHIRAIRASKSFKESDFEGKYVGWEM